MRYGKEQLEEAFKRLVKLNEYIAKSGVTLSVKTLQNELTEALNIAAAGIGALDTFAPREVVQIASGNSVVALCSDGALFYLEGQSWRPIAKVPQPDEGEKQNER